MDVYNPFKLHSCLYTIFRRWLPHELSGAMMLVLLGYKDGVLRLYEVESEGDSSIGGGNIYKLTRSLTIRFRLILAQKPHGTPVRTISVCPHHQIIATLGSGNDNSLFCFLLKDGCRLIPVRALRFQYAAVAFAWKLDQDNNEVRKWIFFLSLLSFPFPECVHMLHTPGLWVCKRKQESWKRAFYLIHELVTD